VKIAKLSTSEVEDFWALGISIEAPAVPDDEYARALADGRVQVASFFSSMGTAETGWRKASSTERKPDLDYVVVPPGQTAFETAYEDFADDRDVDGVLWDPWRSERVLRLVAGVPDMHAAAVMAACERVLVGLEKRFSRSRKPRPPLADVEGAITAVMRRIDDFAPTTMWKAELRFAVVRAVVALAWGRTPPEIDVDAAWKR